ncbi:MAG: protein kinase, partial [Streptomyces sp.]|nr:protein kinase [Streptomyces sp.]
MTDGRTHQSDGRLVGGRYRLAEPLGTGAAGTVWRAYDERTDREVAVKEPRLPGDPGNPEDDEYRRAAHRLYREARAAARVDHPSAVSVHDVVVEEGDGADGLPWIVMELVRGETLGALVARGPLDPPEAARIGLAVLGALRAAHSVGIVHRDLRPANVLVESGTDRVVLTDFGITGGRDADARFVAPERMSGRGAGPASDLWSLGALLRAAVEDGGPLDALITRLLDPDPKRRPGAAEAAGELEAVAGEAVVRGPVAVAVRNSAPDVVRDAVPEAVRDAVPEAVRDAVSEAVRDSASDVVRDAVPQAVRDSVPEAVSEGTGNAEAGTPPGPAAPLSHPRPPHPPRHLLHRPAALAFLGTLLLTAL